MITILITDKWMESARILQLLAIGGAFIPVAWLYSNLLMSRGRSNVYMWNVIALGLVQLAAMLLLSPYGIRRMVAVYVGIQIAWLLVWHYFAKREIGLQLKEALKDVGAFAGIAALAMAVAWQLTRGIGNLYGLFFAKIAVAALFYVACMWFGKSVTFRESIGYLLDKKRKGKNSGK